MCRGLTLKKLNSHHSALAKPEKQSAAEERLEQALLKGLSSGPSLTCLLEVSQVQKYSEPVVDRSLEAGQTQSPHKN